MKEDKITELVICLGSSCFARGNKKTLESIQAYIKENKLDAKVKFCGNHCFGKCHNGPVLKIGETMYEQINKENLNTILDKEFKK